MSQANSTASLPATEYWAPGALLGLLAWIAQGDCVGLIPMQIAIHPAAAPFMTVVPIKEGHLDLTLGVMARGDAMLKPAVGHFITHLHRAVHHWR